MRQIADIRLSSELLLELMSKHLEVPTDARLLHCFFDEKTMTLRVRLEHETLPAKPEGQEIPWIDVCQK